MVWFNVRYTRTTRGEGQVYALRKVQRAVPGNTGTLAILARPVIRAFPDML